MIDIEKVVSAINYNGNPLELAGGGGASYVDITLTQDYTSGYSVDSALKTASGFANYYAELISPVPESGPCITGIYAAIPPGSTVAYVYRRLESGKWGLAGLGGQSAYAGDIFRVWEVG